MLYFLDQFTDMFTGLICDIGAIDSVDKTDAGFRFTISALFASDLVMGESVAVNGVCLTVIEFSKNGFSADVIPATLEATTLGRLNVGGKVNLERALKVGDRLGGHFVQGHVDGVGKVISVVNNDSGQRLVIQPPVSLLRYIALKGSVVLDGVSLTVSQLLDKSFEVSLVPHTLDQTTLGDLKENDSVNVEVDVLARYLEQINISV